MDEKKKLKKTSAVIRTAVTKIMNKLKNELDSQSVDNLHEHSDYIYLNENLKELRELDKKIQNIIEVEEEFDAEIQYLHSGLPAIRKEKLSVYTFANKTPIEKDYDVVKLTLKNKGSPNLKIDIEALVTGQISVANIPASEKDNIP
ncbi:uncharacterized protein TNCV_968211 [Trichonephila clavipes]|nr:uncharacterized protein TNCV_968211 [Trichonephila clavipes]